MKKKESKSVAIIYIAMGDELHFWDKFYHSSEYFLLPNYHKQYFVISDKELRVKHCNVRSIKLEINEILQPYHRFKISFVIRELISEFDYSYFFSPDTEFISTISDEAFLPKEDQSLVVYGKYPDIDHTIVNDFPYERRNNSNSYIPYNTGEHYFSVALFGGVTEAFLSSCRCINALLEDDISYNFFSEEIGDKHLTRYFQYKDNIKILPANFIKSQGELWKINAKILNRKNLSLSSDDILDVMETINHLDKIFSYQSWSSFLELQQNVAMSWRKLLKAYLYNKLERFDFLAKKRELIGKKIIWQYWGQGVNSELPRLVEVCFSSVDRNKGEYSIIRLDDNNIQDYLDLPDFIWKKKESFGAALFSDILRLALLYIYGGIWIDATIILSSPLPDKLLTQDFFLFSRDSENPNKSYWEGINKDYFCWDKDHYVNTLNSFIISKPRDIITETVLQLMLNYWKTQERAISYYIFQILFEQIMNYYLTDQNFLVLDDTFPHELMMKLWSDYNKREIDELFDKCQVHKLTLHADLSGCGENSVWRYLETYF